MKGEGVSSRWTSTTGPASQTQEAVKRAPPRGAHSTFTTKGEGDHARSDRAVWPGSAAAAAADVPNSVAPQHIR